MMNAGRELDALIALEVFRYTLDYEFADTLGAPNVRELRDQFDDWGILPHYSTEIGDAWLVVEKLYSDGIGTTFSLSRSLGVEKSRYRVGFSQNVFGRDDGWAYADTAPLAICRAALAACGVPS
jgi:hypothetical protein